MVKYETTLEEAKEIKKLGFDFSEACEKFMRDNSHDPNLKGERTYYKNSNEVYLDINSYYFTDSEYDQIDISVYDCFSKDYWSDTFTKSLIPIIPYPILEACLPAVRTKAPFNGFVDSSIRALFFGTYQMIDEQIDDYSCLDDYILNDFENVYEAFIWCAENYLEETKKRFNEVIDQIREGLDNREEDCSNSKGGKNELY